MARRRLPELLAVPAAVRFVSAEPLLGPLDLRAWLGGEGAGEDAAPAVRWVITGGESGGTPARRLVERAPRAPGAGRLASPEARWRLRPHAAGWLRSLRDQCRETGTAFFLKQLGGPTPKAGGRALDGVVWHQYPDGTGFARPLEEVA